LPPQAKRPLKAREVRIEEARRIAQVYLPELLSANFGF
jgi:hypothetical protein